MPTSPDTLRMVLSGFASITWNTASESTTSGLLIEVLATWAKFLQPFGYCTRINFNFTFCTNNVFRFFCVVVDQFQLIKYKFSNWTTLHVHLRRFQITHDVKQYTTCQHTNYHDTINHREYLPGLEMLRSRDKRAAS